MKCHHPERCYTHKKESVVENEMYTNGLPNLGLMTLIDKKKGTCSLVGFDVSTDHRKKKINENEGLKNILGRCKNMKVTVIPIVIGAHRTDSKNLEKRLEDQKI